MNLIERVLRHSLPHPHPAPLSRAGGSWGLRGNLLPGFRSALPPTRGRLGEGILALVLALLLVAPAQAIDPLYQRQMERLTEIMGSLYFLEPLCETGTEDWRAQAAELIALDEPDDDRRQRLAGAFNTGYSAFSRLHRQCTPSSRAAMTRLLDEAQQLAREIHTRFAE